MIWPRQLSTFFGVGLVATVADYGTLVLLREVFGTDPVYGALAGYCAGGIVSYLLNRSHTFETARSHGEAGWRFAVVMAIGFLLTGLLMWLFVNKLALPYILARVIATGIVFCWNFVAHKLWTFADNGKTA